METKTLTFSLQERQVNESPTSCLIYFYISYSSEGIPKEANMSCDFILFSSMYYTKTAQPEPEAAQQSLH